MHVRHRPRNMNMGFLDKLASGFASGFGTDAGGMPGGQGAAPPGASAGLTAAIAVSPTIQTEVSPQISPVFQQTESGAQTAGTTMVAPGGQEGTGGSATALPSMPETGIPSGSSYMPASYPVSSPYAKASPYNDPFMPGFDINRYVPAGATPGSMIEAQTKPDLMKWGIIGGTVLIGGILLATFLPKPKRARAA